MYASVAVMPAVTLLLVAGVGFIDYHHSCCTVLCLLSTFEAMCAGVFC